MEQAGSGSEDSEGSQDSVYSGLEDSGSDSESSGNSHSEEEEEEEEEAPQAGSAPVPGKTPGDDSRPERDEYQEDSSDEEVRSAGIPGILSREKSKRA
ncbi:PREDICTED: ribosome biogenesis protein bop1-A-like, partial [Pseudopodoces humilis]|uniref:ribosome biogenesis protein bop1-A-like n=1 Tax=Pseudopodoces humilis TaxID=181119 RepID=UPI0006B7583B